MNEWSYQLNNKLLHRSIAYGLTEITFVRFGMWKFNFLFIDSFMYLEIYSDFRVIFFRLFVVFFYRLHIFLVFLGKLQILLRSDNVHEKDLKWSWTIKHMHVLKIPIRRQFLNFFTFNYFVYYNISMFLSCI